MATATPIEKLLRPTEVAEILGRSVDALKQLRYRGDGPEFVRTGHLVRYRPSAVEAYLHNGARDRT